MSQIKIYWLSCSLLKVRAVQKAGIYPLFKAENPAEKHLYHPAADRADHKQKSKSEKHLDPLNKNLISAYQRINISA